MKKYKRPSPSKLSTCRIEGASRALIKALKAYNYLGSYGNLDSHNPWVKNLVDNFGFTIVASEADRKEILINKKLKLVVKVMYSIGQVPINRAPTRFIANLSRDEYSRYDVVLQSLVNISEKAKAKAQYFIENSKDSSIKYGFDAHEKNYGLYKNKAVVFDW